MALEEVKSSQDWSCLSHGAHYYSRVKKSIENWSVCSKMALGEVGVSLP